MLPCHRAASSATLSRAVPSSFRQHRSRLRRSSTSCAGGNPLLLPLRLQPLSLLVAVGAPLWPPQLPSAAAFHRTASWSRSQAGRPARLGPRQTLEASASASASTSARGPKTGDPEMEETARREMVTAPLPPPEDPRRCLIRALLSFLQQGLERRLSPSTLKVYVATISTHHDPVEGKSVGKHNLVVRFLRGARRLNPPRPPSLPSWDLALVLRALITSPFEPLQSAFATALASIKRVGDLQAFSVDDSCLEFGPADSSATLRPRPSYVPKVPTTPFRDQVVNLRALPPEEADPALALLCPVRALRQYTDRTQSFKTSEQLFVCYGGQQKGKAVSKQRMAHWIVDAITLAYEAQSVPCPLRLRAHSTRGVASSWALARGVSLADICRAAGWATPNTFSRFYSLRVEPVSSCVLTSNG